MDASLLDQSLSYHGPALMEQLNEEHGESLQVPAALRRRYSATSDSASVKDHCLREGKNDEELMTAVHKFIARKADFLFHRVRKKSVSRETSESDQPEDVFGIMPPLESFMGVPSDVCQDHFYENLRAGDVVIGVMSSVSDSGVIATLLCTEMPGLYRDIDELNISAFCPAKELPRMFSHQSLTEAYHPRDVFRGIILAVNPEKKRIFVSLRESTSTSEEKLPKIGLISKDDFPVHYRRKLERCGLSYSELLTSILGFTNKGSVDVLQSLLGLSNSASLMRGLHRVKVPEEEYAEALRKWQTNKQVHNSVVMGVEMMKKGRHLEAIQNLNMALKIDPCHTEALVARGAVYANNASYQKAIDDFGKALEGNPSHVNAKKYLVETRVACARWYEDEGNLEEAVENYREVLKLDPRSTEAKHGLEKCRRLQGKEQSTKGSKSSGSDSSSSSEEEGDNLQKSADKLIKLMKAEKKDGRKKRDSGPSSPGSSKKSRKKKERKKSKEQSDSSSSSPSAPRSPHAELNKMFEEWQSQQSSKISKERAPSASPSASPSKRRPSSNGSSRHRKRHSHSSSSVSSQQRRSRKRRSKSSSRSSSSSRSRSQSSSSTSRKGNSKGSFGHALMDAFLQKSDGASAAEGKDRAGGANTKWDDLSTYIGASSRQLDKVLVGLRPTKKRRSRSQSSSRGSSSDSSDTSRERKRNSRKGSADRRDRNRDRRDSRDHRRSRSHRRSASREGGHSRQERYSRDSRGSAWRGRRGSRDFMDEKWHKDRKHSREERRHKDHSGHFSGERKHVSKHKEKKSGQETKGKESKENKRFTEDKDLSAVAKDMRKMDGNKDYRNENTKDDRKSPDKQETKPTDIHKMDRKKGKGVDLDDRTGAEQTSEKKRQRGKDSELLQTVPKEKGLSKPVGVHEAEKSEKSETPGNLSMADQERTEKEIAAIIAKNGSLTVPSKWDSPTRRSRWDLEVGEGADVGQKRILVKPVVTDVATVSETGEMKVAEPEKREQIKLIWNQHQRHLLRPEVGSRWSRVDRPAAKDSESSRSPGQESSAKNKGAEAQSREVSRAWSDVPLGGKKTKPTHSTWSDMAAARVPLEEEPRHSKDDVPSKRYGPEAVAEQTTESDVVKGFRELVSSKWDEDASPKVIKERADRRPTRHESAAPPVDDEKPKWLTEEEEYYRASLPRRTGSEGATSRWSQHEALGKNNKDMSFKKAEKDEEFDTVAELEEGKSWSRETTSIKESREILADRPVKRTEHRLTSGDRDDLKKRPKTDRSGNRSSEQASYKWIEKDVSGKPSRNEGRSEKSATVTGKWMEEEEADKPPGKPTDSGGPGIPSSQNPSGRSGQETQAMDLPVDHQAKKDKLSALQQEPPGKMSELKELMLQHLTLQKLELQHLSLEDLEKRLCQEIVGYMSTNTSTASEDSGLSQRRLEPERKERGLSEHRDQTQDAGDASHIWEVDEQPEKTKEPSQKRTRRESWEFVEARSDRHEYHAKPDQRNWESSEGPGLGHQEGPDSPHQSPKSKASEESDGMYLRREEREKRSRAKSPLRRTERRKEREDDESIGQTDDPSCSYSTSTKILKTERYSQRDKSEEREKRTPNRDGKDRKRSPEQGKYTVETSSRHRKDSSMSSWMEKIISNVDVKPSSKVNPGDVDIHFLFRTSSGTVDSSFSHQLVPNKRSASSSRKRKRSSSSSSSSSSSEQQSSRARRGCPSYQHSDSRDKSKKKKRRRSSSSSSSSSANKRRREKLHSSAQKKKRHRSPSSSSSSSSTSSEERREHTKRYSSSKKKRSRSSSSTSTSDDRQRKKSVSSATRGKKREKQLKSFIRSSSSSSSSSSPSSSSSSSPRRKRTAVSQRQKGKAGSSQKFADDCRQEKPALPSKSSDAYSEATKFADGEPAQPSKNKLNELEDFLKELKSKKKEKLMAQGKGKKA